MVTNIAKPAPDVQKALSPTKHSTATAARRYLQDTALTDAG